MNVALPSMSLSSRTPVPAEGASTNFKSENIYAPMTPPWLLARIKHAMGTIGKLRRLVSDDSGMTLIELLIAMMLFSVLGYTVFIVMDTFQTTQATTLGRFSGTSSAATILDRLTRHLRAAITPAGATSPFIASPSPATSPSASDVWFYANLGGSTPTEIHAYVTTSSGTCPCTLHEDQIITTSSGVVNGTTTTTTTVVSSIDGTGLTSQNIFTYYGAPTYNSTTSTLASPVSTLTDVAEIGINITTQLNSVSPSVSAKTLVYLRNVG